MTEQHNVKPSWNVAEALWRRSFLLLLGGLIFGFPGCRREPQYDNKPLSYWKTQLQSKDAKQRQKAIDALSEMGRAAVPALADLLQDKDREIRKKAVKALIEMQVGAFVEISEWATGNEDALKILRELCLEEETEGYFTALALAGPDAVPIFEEFVQSEDRKIAWTAALALEDMVPSEAAVPILKMALKNPHREVRERAAESLRACLQVE